ncbi:hypothetical protein RHMOL_Rhmol07G0219500 [Rhododendron molle]|uniref:Uncharacterized protein n=2 Tax=Rhododendron molle TaxID=49168 RepID=A0ACC0N4E7_RHOML|nr:hypothetical protein RHMOL_Rhmol07G0219500 [Rhododendron molle]
MFAETKVVAFVIGVRNMFSPSNGLGNSNMGLGPTKPEFPPLTLLASLCAGQCQTSDGHGSPNGDLDPQTRELFLPFRCFCTRKDIHCLDIVLEGTDVVEALVEFVRHSAIEILVLGAHSKSGGFLRYEPPLVLLQSLLNWRFKATDIPSNVSKAVPGFCNVYVISTDGKISSTRSASRHAPTVSPLRNQIPYQAQIKSDSVTPLAPCISTRGAPKVPSERQLQTPLNNPDFIRILMPLEAPNVFRNVFTDI